MPRSTATQRQIIKDFVTCINTGNFVGNVSTAGSVDLSGGLLTIAAWVKPKVFQTSSPFIASIAGEETNTDTDLALLRIGDGSGVSKNKNVSFALKFASIANLNSVTTLIANKWYHLVAVYDGTNMLIYINGVLDNSVAQSGSFTANFFFHLSQSAGGGARFFNGLIDDVRVYKRALSLAEIAGLYNDLEPSTANLTIYYKCDEGSGATLVDSSPGGTNTGTLVSCTYSTDVLMIPRSTAGARTVAAARTLVS